MTAVNPGHSSRHRVEIESHFLKNGGKAFCSCGWEGPERDTSSKAAHDAAFHASEVRADCPPDTAPTTYGRNAREGAARSRMLRALESPEAVELVRIAAEHVPDRCRCYHDAPAVECSGHKMARLARSILKEAGEL